MRGNFIDLQIEVGASNENLTCGDLSGTDEGCN